MLLFSMKCPFKVRQKRLKEDLIETRTVASFVADLDSYEEYDKCKLISTDSYFRNDDCVGEGVCPIIKK